MSLYCKHKKIIILLAFLSALPFSQVSAQQKIIDNQLWVDVNPHIEINKRWEYFGDISYRTILGESKFSRFVFRPSVQFHWTYELDLIGGVGLFLTWEERNYSTVELRPYQGAKVNWPSVWRFNFKHRVLVEERLLWNNLGVFEPNFRFRYRLKTKFPINKPNVGYKTIYLPLSYEIFGNTGDEDVELFRNQARAVVGLGYVFSHRWIAEFEFTFQRSRSNIDDDYKLSDRIFRFKLIYDGWIFGE